MLKFIKDLLSDLKTPYFRNHFYALVVSFIFNLCLTWAVLTYVPMFSAFPIALDFIWLSMFVWFMLDLVWFREVDFIQEMQKNPYFLPAIILGIFLILASVSAKAQPEERIYGLAHLDTALSYVGVVEKTGNNDGEVIERFLAQYKAKAGTPYCAAFVSYCLTQSSATYPQYRGLLARGFVKNGISMQTALIANLFKTGDIIVWQRGNSIYGHTGFIISYNRNQNLFKTVEANTTPEKGTGSQFDGDGIYIRTRTYQPVNYFRMTHINKVLYIK